MAVVTMTYQDVLVVPDGTLVRLADGQVGRIASWYHTAESIGVRVGLRPMIVVHSASLSQTQSGEIVEFHPTNGRRR